MVWVRCVSAKRDGSERYRQGVRRRARQGLKQSGKYQKRRADQSKGVKGALGPRPRCAGQIGWPRERRGGVGISSSFVRAAARCPHSGGGMSGSRRGAECLRPAWQVQRSIQKRARGRGSGHALHGAGQGNARPRPAPGACQNAGAILCWSKADYCSDGLGDASGRAACCCWSSLIRHGGFWAAAG